MAGSAVHHATFAEWLRRLPLFRAGPRDAQPLVIGNRRIYVLPTGFGLFIGIALAVLNLGSLNYNNNAALLLGFLVISLCNNALIGGHLALLGLKLRSQPPEPVFAGQLLELSVMVSPRGSEPRDFTLSYHTSESAFRLGAEPIITTLSLPTEKRGRLHIDRVRIATLHPLGLARAWCTLNLQEQALVYPVPQGQDLNTFFPVSRPAVAGKAGSTAISRIIYAPTAAAIPANKSPGNPARAPEICRSGNMSKATAMYCFWTGTVLEIWITKPAFPSYVSGSCRPNSGNGDLP